MLLPVSGKITDCDLNTSNASKVPLCFIIYPTAFKTSVESLCSPIPNHENLSPPYYPSPRLQCATMLQSVNSWYANGVLSALWPCLQPLGHAPALYAKRHCVPQGNFLALLLCSHPSACCLYSQWQELGGRRGFAH